ncbi:hypothetical protein J4E83_010978 [Alternaria metachromatica]|uniref:uncharacterized protein n=1 Tax=Alternaria metachromatica TaxID=283354 RepID=UPI0020C498CB|nr:uncharacterized protein J4E83_010978 [Alternaria metachromatica]KAI4604737.1 hypothetical protein J4E83_010978 [Alternaria metachromatica]
MHLPDNNPKLSMSLPEEQQEDTSSSMISSGAQPEKLSIEKKLAFEQLRIKAARGEQGLKEITYLNVTTSPLLLLPAEIRNMIFALALDHQDILILNERIYNEIRSPVNLLHVCRQIHAETALLPYKLNFFAVAIWERRLLPFLERRTQAQRDVMTDLPDFQIIDTANELLAMRKRIEYDGIFALAIERILKDMNARLSA